MPDAVEAGLTLSDSNLILPPTTLKRGEFGAILYMKKLKQSL